MIDCPPNYTATVTFPYDVRVFPGLILNILEVDTKPRPRWRAIDDATYYTIIMISPDLPQHNVPYAEWNPWIVRNIPGLKRAKGQTIIPYNMPEEPRRNATFLMYVFLIYKQNEYITYNDSYYQNEGMIERGEFRVRKYTQIYNLTCPEAGNYYVLTFYQPPAAVETTRSTVHFEW
ncbi:putative odorant-binding protein A5 isoform X2 [Planococcus citri]